MLPFDPLTLFWLTGLVGVAFYLGSYAALQSGLIRGSGWVYTVLNLLAASFVLVSLMAEWSMSSALIQISWITISVIGLGRLWLRQRMLRFTQEERHLAETCFATMHGLDARKFLDKGVWMEAPAGYVLTQEGQPVEHLHYIECGGVDVFVGDLKIAHVGMGDFIGEMGCLSHGAASATTKLSEQSRMFRISSDEISRLLRRHPDLLPHLEYAFAHKTRRKLLETNTALRDALLRETGVKIAG